MNYIIFTLVLGAIFGGVFYMGESTSGNNPTQDRSTINVNTPTQDRSTINVNTIVGLVKLIVGVVLIIVGLISILN
tara:strand:- start:99 stop:326 length:228 start_codon:yes stop_codon:yes gene_type:complete